jgi:hypothetical protein
VDSEELMKRSEAVEVIINFLEEWYGEDRPVKIASNLLTELESMGMLPPKTKLNTLNIEDNAWEPEQ